MEKKKAMIAMSGGVDSSVAAFLMKEQGFDCIGATMKLYHNEDIGMDREKTCCSLDDIEDARRVAMTLGMPYYVFNFSDSFREFVIEPFIASYEKGYTPNPCIECNKHLKFRRFLRRADEIGCDFVVTGHYAVIEYDEEKKRYLLKKGADASKDQSYVLYAMTQEELARTKLPLGSLNKSEVRRIAEENGFVNAKKHDSQDICFVPDGDYAAFMEGYTGKCYPKGDFLSTTGEKLGEHKGAIRYTIGQRKGLGISHPTPLYVKGKDMEKNAVILCENSELFARSLEADELNLIDCERIEGKRRVSAKIRYRHAEQPAFVEQIGEDRIRVTFDEPQRAITPGQAVVLYDGDVVVGGATIVKSLD